MYKHILVPLENGSADGAILAHIRQLARLVGAKLTLVHVADGFAARNQAPPMNLAESDEMRRDRAYLERVRTELQSEGFDVDAVLKWGEPGDEILDEAEKRGCDLIAMSTHGHGWFGDFILGSVSSKVRHGTHIPVLLVRAT